MNKLRRSLPSMNGLFTFEAAARCGNFSKAANELNVTPAAVSRMIARLEEHLDTALFSRQPGGVGLTEPGRILFDAIARGFSGIENALREIEDRRIGIQTVSLSVSTGFITHWMMPRMAEFKKQFPTVDLRFQLVMGALAGPVNDVDLGMRFVNGSDERHEAVFVMPEILVPICSPAYRESHGPDGNDMKRSPDITINLSDAQPNWSSLFSPANEGDAINSMIFSDYAIVVQAALRAGRCTRLAERRCALAANQGTGAGARTSDDDRPPVPSRPSAGQAGPRHRHAGSRLDDRRTQQ